MRPRHPLIFPTLLRLLAVAMLPGGASLASEESLWDRIQIHGFASQAAVNTSSNRWFGDSPNTSFDFTELGLNVSARLHPKVLLAGQVLVRRAGEMYDGSPDLDYGLADITLTSSPERRLGLRLGRIKNPLGLYNETRDVPFTHPGIFLPQVVYFDRVRNLTLSTDGGMLYAESFNDFGNIAFTLGVGEAVIDENVEWAYLGADFAGDMGANGNTWLGSLWFTNPGEQLKLGISAAVLSIKFDPDSDAPFAPQAGETDIVYGILSAQYNAEQWSLTAEYAREPLQWRGYGPAAPDRESVSEGYYIQGTYRVRPTVQLLLRYEEGYGDTKDRDGTGFEASTGGLVPANFAFSKILSTGVRWDINRHWMVRAEYAYHNGTFVLSTRENPDFGSRESYWNMFAVQAAFRF